MEQYVLQKPEVPEVQLFVSLGKDQRKREKALVNRPEMVDQEPGSFGFLVNLRAYRTESFGFLPEI